MIRNTTTARRVYGQGTPADHPPPATHHRRGTILPLVVISLVALFGLVALAIDVGMIAVTKNQAQNAADVAAVTAARSIDGSTSPDLAQATTNAQNAAMA